MQQREHERPRGASRSLICESKSSTRGLGSISVENQRYLFGQYRTTVRAVSTPLSKLFHNNESPQTINLLSLLSLFISRYTVLRIFISFFNSLLVYNYNGLLIGLVGYLAIRIFVNVVGFDYFRVEGFKLRDDQSYISPFKCSDKW